MNQRCSHSCLKTTKKYFLHTVFFHALGIDFLLRYHFLLKMLDFYYKIAHAEYMHVQTSQDYLENVEIFQPIDDSYYCTV